jgi:hypothetical protein
MATLTAEGRREEQSVEHNRLARAYLESKGVKLAWIGDRIEHYEGRDGSTPCPGGGHDRDARER